MPFLPWQYGLFSSEVFGHSLLQTQSVPPYHNPQMQASMDSLILVWAISHLSPAQSWLCAEGKNMAVVDLLVQQLEDEGGQTVWEYILRRPVVIVTVPLNPSPCSTKLGNSNRKMTLIATSWSHLGNCGPEICLLFHVTPETTLLAIISVFPSVIGPRHMVSTQCMLAKYQKSLDKWKPFSGFQVFLYNRIFLLKSRNHWVSYTSTFCVRCPIHLQRREKVCEIYLVAHFIFMNKLLFLIWFMLFSPFVS